MKSDAKIQEDVLRELDWDPRIDATVARIEVDDGIVTLTGTAESYAKRLAAQEAAHRVAGVHDVANEIQVKVPGSQIRTDTEIAHAVRRDLEWDVLVPSERIQSTVSNEWVTLEGTVESYHERAEAARTVQHLAGVHGLIDRIVVTRSSLDAAAVRQEIEKALERRYERATRHMEVTVSHGRVVLSGPVQSCAEREAILGAARFAKGVREIEDHLYLRDVA